MMKTKRLCQAVYLLFCLIQIALLGAVYILQTLTTKKAGVNHHLRFTRTYWMHNYLTPQNTLIFSIILVLIAAVIFVALFRLWNKTGIYSKIAFILSAVDRCSAAFPAFRDCICPFGISLPAPCRNNRAASELYKYRAGVHSTQTKPVNESIKKQHPERLDPFGVFCYFL